MVSFPLPLIHKVHIGKLWLIIEKLYKKVTVLNNHTDIPDTSIRVPEAPSTLTLEGKIGISCTITFKNT